MDCFNAIFIFQHFMGITVDIDFKLIIHNSWMLPDDSPAKAVSYILNTDLQESWNKEILRSKLFCYEFVSSSCLNIVQSYVLNQFLPWWSCLACDADKKKTRDQLFFLHVKVVKLVIKINCCGLHYFTQEFLPLVMFPKYIQFWRRNYLFIICCVEDKNWKLELPSWQN